MKVNTNDLKWYGRYSDLDGIRYFDYSASGFEFCFTGKKAVVTILSDPELFDDNTKLPSVQSGLFCFPLLFRADP